MSLQKTVADSFKAEFGEPPAIIVRAPGRVNLIGEHTDYNDGFVLPMTINRAVWIGLRPRTDKLVKVKLLDFDDPVTFDLNDIEHQQNGPAEYVKGVAWALQQAGYVLNGWEGTLKGDVPIGAGLSSSAALEMATARAFDAVSSFDWVPSKMALLGQQAENDWIGVKTGIMDQMISASGEANHALLIDCRSLETRSAPLPDGTAIVVLDTNTRRGLVDSKYNERREQCESAAEFFGVKALRDVTIETFNAKSSGLDDVTMRRARHIITENDRTLRAHQALADNDAAHFGVLMNASHDSLRDDFEVSSDALNIIVKHAQNHAGCYGARMTGAGFGGCAVALVRASVAEDFADIVAQGYTDETEITPQVYICYATNGAEIVKR